jgi:Fe-S-cluster-containing dehydrogenase component
MLIDQDRCVRCDDCVRACANGHDNNPRFIRHGKTFANWMVTNACMHCSDPVCMIGCPTGAIHRIVDGTVIINDDTCIGCASCANSCPYHNIRMVEIRDKEGRFILDDKQEPRLKATKCDLCASQPGGPACVRACPHDALRRVDFQTQVSLS